MIVRVTAEHIAKGKKENCAECPTALALKELGIKEPEVSDPFLFYLDKKGNLKQVRLPYKVLLFEKAFDQNSHVVPYIFNIEIT